MIPLTINIHDKVKEFLDRYYDNNLTIEERFFLALSEGSVLLKGKAYYLSTQSAEDLKIAISEEEREMLNRHREYPYNEI